MPEAESGIIALFGDSPRIRLLEYLMEFQKHKFTPSEIVKSVGMSRTTAFKELKKLFTENMIIKTEPIGKSPTYQINMSSPIIQVMQSTVSFRSKKAADSQIVSRKLSNMMMRQINHNVEALQLRKKVLSEELSITKNKLKEIPV